MTVESYLAQASFARSTVVVSNAADIAAAVKTLSAQGGGTILLDGSAGTYNINLSSLGSTAAPILLAPLDPEQPPVIETMTLNRCSGLTITGMDFTSSVADHQKDITITYGKDITLVGNTMTGTAEGFYSETGSTAMADTMMFVRYCNGLTFAENTVSNYFSAIGMLDSKNIVIEGNDFSKLQGDGIQGGGWDGVKIADNYMHDFYGSTQTVNHTDMIQIWGTNTSFAARNVEITGNVLDAGDGAVTQGIFIRNEDFGTTKAASGYLQNISITNNTIYNGAPNGISVADVDGLVLENNTVLWDKGISTWTSPTTESASVMPWVRVENVVNADIDSNIAGRYVTTNVTYVDGSAGNNILIDYKNPFSEFYVYNHFNDLLAEGSSITNLMLKTGSSLQGYGATIDPAAFGIDLKVPVILPEVSPYDPHTVTMNAAFLDADGHTTIFTGDAETVVRWTLADGTVLYGDTLRHSFATGEQTVKMDLVSLSNGEAIVGASRSFDVKSDVLVQIDFDNGVTDTGGRNSAIIVHDGSGTALQAGHEGTGFHLAQGNSVELTRANGHLYALQNFNIDLDIKLDAGCKSGDILSQHTICTLTMTTAGELAFVLNTDTGRYVVRSDAHNLTDSNWHNIGVNYDGLAGKLQLLSDGKVIGEVEAHGTTATPTPWGMTLGATFGTSINATVDNLEISQPASSLADTFTPPVAGTLAVAKAWADMFAQSSLVAEPEHKTLLDFDFNHNALDHSEYASKTVVRDGGTDHFVFLNGDEGFHMGGANRIDVTAKTIGQLSHLDDFQFDMTIAKGSAAASGGLLTLHTILDMDVLDDGALRCWVQTDEGKFWIKTAAGVLSDTDTHDISLRYSDADHSFELYVDDTLAAHNNTASGTTGAVSYWALSIGDTWGKTVDAVIDHFSVSTIPDDLLIA